MKRLAITHSDFSKIWKIAYDIHQTEKQKTEVAEIDFMEEYK